MARSAAPAGGNAGAKDAQWQDRISLIIPCYNAELYISEAVASALSQSRAPDEIIVIDDGSTDASATIVEAMRVPQLRLVRRAHQGDPAGRNFALEIARGGLIAFLDADDLWPADSLALRLEALNAHPEKDYCYGAVDQFPSPDLDPSRRIADAPPVTGRMLGASLFRRSVFDRLGGFDPSINFGYVMEWLARAQQAGIAGIGIDRLVLRRRIHNSNSVYDEAALRAHYLRAIRSTLRLRRSGPA
ncbi:glycosyltransferase family 2 protein [Sphingomonas sp.]|uniref:glycosyltransferase family 2 protein n=1 Tax=Sphingomonas sp. TaxID=28214 RepID=UPI002FC60240